MQQVLTEQEFLGKYLPDKTLQAVFNNLPADLKETTRTLFEKKNMNGELTDIFKSGAPATKEFLTKKKTELDKEAEIERKEQEKIRLKAEEDAKRLQDLNNAYARVRFRNPTIKQLLGINVTGKSNSEVIQILKSYHATESQKVLTPILNAVGISDQKIQDQIQHIAISAVYNNLFGFASYVNNSHGQLANFARILENELKRVIFKYKITDSDEQITSIMQQKRKEMIESIAADEAAETGISLEGLQFQITANMPSIIEELKTAAIS